MPAAREGRPQPDERETGSCAYARVVAWGTGPDGTPFQSACTVYEDPVTGARREDTTTNWVLDGAAAVLMVRRTGM